MLNALAGRLPKSNQGRLEGQLLVNGHPRGAGFRSIAAFVQQDDVLFPNLTVRETLTFAAGEQRGQGWLGQGARGLGHGSRSSLPVQRLDLPPRPALQASACRAPWIARPRARWWSA